MLEFEDVEYVENEVEVFEYPEVKTCPICNVTFEQRKNEDWYSTDTDFLLLNPGDGPDGEWYCSNSCRSQAMYKTMNPAQRQALKNIYRFTTYAGYLANTLGLSYDGSDKRWGMDSKHPLFQWLSDGEKVPKILNACIALSDELEGDISNDQPEWIDEVV